MHVEDLLVGMRSGQAQPAAAIEAFVEGVVAGRISRPQAAAWLAWALARGLDHDETVALTRAMTHSGTVLSWADGPALWDKHSTGGVGDKVSLVLAPLWACLGRRVPMISGRGLGMTGGTLDKLEAIPGYRTGRTEAELRAQLDAVGAFICEQTEALAPANRILYALRNEVQCVPSVPLIVGSILSKKLAEGVEELVLDVKAGSGAFMPTLHEARALATALVEVATANGVRCRALLTEMSRPLGRAIGNAVEVEEAVACLKGGGPQDLRELTLALAEHPDAAAALDDGRALAVFVQMIEAQGGDPRIVDASERLQGAGARVAVVEAPASGVVARLDAGALGRAAFLLGAGRRRAEDGVDPGVGLRLHASVGDDVEAGTPIVSILHRDGRALEEARSLVTSALRVSSDAGPAGPVVLERLGLGSAKALK